MSPGGPGMKLEVLQQQRLLMTPMMQQAVLLLQMSALELQQHIQAELLRNPTLEDASTTEGEDQSETPEETEGEETKLEDLLELSPEWKEIFSDGTDTGYRPPAREDGAGEVIEATLTQLPSIQDHLLWQLHLSTSDETVIRVGHELITNIDDDGYLGTPPEEIAERTGVDRESFQRAYELVRSFDPIGVCAVDLRDCLLLQIRHLGEEGSWAEKIIEKHLEDLEKNRLPRIAKEMGITMDTLAEAVEKIRSLEPKPAKSFGRDETRYVVPDVFIEKIDGEYTVTLNEDWLPKVRLSPYYKRLYDKGANDEVVAFLKERIQSAVWLLKSIDQRQRTLFKVTRAIVDHQKDFFEYGLKHMKPLTLHEIADVIEMHESTVSRVTTEKYAQTPRGTFELKFFFSSGIETAAGGDASSKSIKAIMREIIENEDPAKPLSDQRITEILNGRGFRLARRTVTKYRKQLGVLSAGRRRRY